MEFILQLILTPVVILLASKAMSKVHVKNYASAFWASLWIIIVGFLVGWLLTFLLNLATLGIIWIIGLGVITRTIAYAIVIEIVDALSKDFKTNGFIPSLILSVLLAITWGIIDMIF